MSQKPQPPDIEAKARYVHRDLSWLRFNGRVLEEAEDASNPLLERVKFLAIFVNNLDEFFMVRVAGIKTLLESQFGRRDVYGYYPAEIFAEIKSISDEMTRKIYKLYQKLTAELAKNRIVIKSSEELSAGQKRFINGYFESTLFPILTPMAVDQGHPFPVLPSKTIAFAVHLTRKGEPHLAVMPVPQNVGRLLKLPPVKDEESFILIDEVIRSHLKRFFQGYKIVDQALFRVMRDSELSVDEGFAPDLLKAIEEQVKRRTFARTVFLETESDCSPELLTSLCQCLSFPESEVIRVGHNIDLSFLFGLYAQVDRPDLRDRSYVPAKSEFENIFDRVREEDFILHVPFEDFAPTVQLIQAAAQDPDVLAIKMTLYRTNENSQIVAALKEAAANKKQVTVLVEIKARFDEENNINWARELEEAGCHVIYGIPGLKIHSKMSLIVRNEDGRITRYVHLATGNYNEKTARIYTDLGYFTANDDFARDISDVFNVITGYSIPSPWKRIVSSPTDLREYFFALIDREIAYQKKYNNGLIEAKLNSLEDPKIIDKLYEASNAGVKVRLIVRGICCLIPGVKGMSENIEVRSVVGRFLEHTRFFIFHNNGSYRVFLSSADWMRRNFDRRIELLFEIYRPKLKEHLRFLMAAYLNDDVKARIMRPDGSYERGPSSGKRQSAQDFLIDYYGKLKG